MLGGARDEVVPRSQMQELWALIRNRGRDTARSKKPPAGGAAGLEKVKAVPAADDEDEEDEDEDEDESEKKGEVAPSAGPGPGPGSDDRKLPPRIIVDGGNKYVEFADGTHSE